MMFLFAALAVQEAALHHHSVVQPDCIQATSEARLTGRGLLPSCTSCHATDSTNIPRITIAYMAQFTSPY